MSKLKARVSYLQGLSEGMKIQDEPQGKLIAELLEIIGELVDALEDTQAELEDMKLYVESIDNDLCDLEDDIYGDENESYIEITCKNCGEDVFFEAELLDEDDVIEIVCPKCNEVVYINDGSFDFETTVTPEETLNQPKPHS